MTPQENVYLEIKLARAKALQERRKELRLTQAQMAERLGISQAQVSRLEKRGYDAYTLSSLRKYVAALGEGYELVVEVRTPDASQ